MAHVLEEYKYKLPQDIWLKIERINLVSDYSNVLNELKNIFPVYWREKFRNYENRFFSGFLNDQFRFCSKYFTHHMENIKYNRISPYHVIYNDHYHIVKYQGKKYKDFYSNNKRILSQ